MEDETARRIKLAESRLDPYFLLLYCDNYWPMQIDKMWPRFVAADAPAMITVYTNKDGYTRNSVRVDPMAMSPSTTKPARALAYRVSKSAMPWLTNQWLSSCPTANVSVEEALIPGSPSNDSCSPMSPTTAITVWVRCTRCRSPKRFSPVGRP